MTEFKELVQKRFDISTVTFDISHLLFRLSHTSFPEIDSYALLVHSPERLQRKHLIIYIYIHEFHRHYIINPKLYVIKPVG
jgi:hypothetical protein